MELNQMDKNKISEENNSDKNHNNAKKKQLTRSNAMSSDDSANRRSKLTQHGSLDNHRDDFTDSNGMDLLYFIQATLHKNRNDREMMLSLEKQMRDFIDNPNERVLRFPKMCSYNRMLVHRVAAVFGLDHNVDNSASQVICTRTPKTHLPDIMFKSLIKNDIFSDDVQKRSTRSFDEVPRAFYPSILPYRPTRSVNPDMMRRTKSVEVDNYQRYIFDNRAGSTYSSNSQLSNASTPTMPLAQSFKNLSLGSSIEPRLMETPLTELPNENQNVDETGDDSMSYSTVSPFTYIEEVPPTPQYMYPVYNYAHLINGIQIVVGYAYVYNATTQIFVPQPNLDLMTTQLGVLTVNGPTLLPNSVLSYYPQYNPNMGYVVSPQMMHPQLPPQMYSYPTNVDQLNAGAAGPSSTNQSEIQSNNAE